MHYNYKIFTDGGSRGNPGPSGAGGVIVDPQGNTVAEVSEFLGIQTNNYSEYQALRLTLIKAIELGIVDIDVFMDSKLIVEQLEGRWKIRNENLKVIYLEIKELLKSFEKVTFKHMPMLWPIGPWILINIFHFFFIFFQFTHFF